MDTHTHRAHALRSHLSVQYCYRVAGTGGSSTEPPPRHWDQPVSTPSFKSRWTALASSHLAPWRQSTMSVQRCTSNSTQSEAHAEPGEEAGAGPGGAWVLWRRQSGRETCQTQTRGTSTCTLPAAIRWKRSNSEDRELEEDPRWRDMGEERVTESCFNCHIHVPLLKDKH